jgi:hypothetical protein
MTDLKKEIQEKRPALSQSSIVTYNSILRNLHRKVFGEGDIKIENFKETEKILDHLKELTPNKRKTILSALVIITDSKKYRDLMLDDIKNYNQEIGKQEKTETQRENWVEVPQIQELWDSLGKQANTLYKKKTGLTGSDFQQIQNFIILSLLGGVLISPRRSKDYCDFKIRNVDKSKDNYLEKGVMKFNSYKTAKCYGTQSVSIPKPLQSILNKWIKVNPTDWLLFDSNQNPLTAVKLNQRLNKLFDGKKISVNALRHSYLTTKFGDTIEKNKAIDQTMADMGSSRAMLTTYVKED